MPTRPQTNNIFYLFVFPDRSDISIISVTPVRSALSEVMSGLLGETKLKILRLLRSEPLHGYALADRLNLSHGYVYTHLGDLEDAGMIEIQEENDGKKVYRLTQNGEYLVKAFDDA